MKNSDLLKNSIETLKLLRVEMHNKMDSREQAKLDEVIKNLEQNQLVEKPFDKSELLKLLGDILKNLPYLSKMIETFVQLFS
ncbi:hypothetical protein O1Q79_01875 [Lonepinella sp. MS14434]|uniref:hypothetical protein n=1 Tax=Lonepinella sp. MS14434 TaxID=3003617 RepID=UPI0036DC7136